MLEGGGSGGEGKSRTGSGKGWVGTEIRSGSGKGKNITGEFDSQREAKGVGVGEKDETSLHLKIQDEDGHHFNHNNNSQVQQHHHQHQHQHLQQHHHEDEEEINIKTLISGLKKLELLTAHYPHPPGSSGSGRRSGSAGGSTSGSGSGWRNSIITTCYEMLYQEIKVPSENHSKFRDWFSLQIHSGHESLTPEEARNIILFAHLHLSENPEVTRQYSITLLKKHCHLTPPTFYKLAKWSYDIRELEKQKRIHSHGGGGGGFNAESSAKWEAVKHCIHHGLFQSHRIAPMYGNCCSTCLKKLEFEGENPIAGELVRSQSSKETRADLSQGISLSGGVGGGGNGNGNGSGGGLERSSSGHTLRESQFCDHCGKNYYTLPAGGSVRQLTSTSKSNSENLPVVQKCEGGTDAVGTVVGTIGMIQPSNETDNDS